MEQIVTRPGSLGSPGVGDVGPLGKRGGLPGHSDLPPGSFQTEPVKQYCGKGALEYILGTG